MKEKDSVENNEKSPDNRKKSGEKIISDNKLAIVLPHPSPLNKKWIKDHPQFLEKRIYEIRELIKKIIK